MIGLWALFALPVWSAAYKQAGAQNPEWTGASHVREDIPGLGLVTRAAPEWDGPSFGKIVINILSSPRYAVSPIWILTASQQARVSPMSSLSSGSRLF